VDAHRRAAEPELHIPARCGGAYGVFDISGAAEAVPDVAVLGEQLDGCGGVEPGGTEMSGDKSGEALFVRGNTENKER